MTDDSKTESFEQVSQTSLLTFSKSAYGMDVNIPKDPEGRIDFKTLGNILFARMEEECIYASYVDPLYGNPSKYEDIDVNSWKYVTNRSGISILNKPEKGSICYCMGRGLVQASLEEVGAVLDDFEQRVKYDEMLKKVESIEVLSKTEKIFYASFSTTRCFKTAEMDFCFYYKFGYINKKFICIAFSIDHPACPPYAYGSRPRGKMLPGTGWLVEEYKSDPQKCIITQIAHINLTGVPSLFIPQVVREQPLVVKHLISYISRSL